MLLTQKYYCHSRQAQRLGKHKAAQGGSDWSRSRDSHLEILTRRVRSGERQHPSPSGVYLRRPQPLTPGTGLPKGGGFLPRPPRPSGRAPRLVTGRHRGSRPGAAAPLLPLFGARENQRTGGGATSIFLSFLNKRSPNLCLFQASVKRR